MSFVEAGGSFLLRGSVSRGRAGGVAWRGGVARAWQASRARELASGSSCATRGGVLCSWRPAGRRGNRRRGKR